MVHRDNPKPTKLSLEELRQFSGNECLSDEQLEEQSNTLLELSIILYKSYQQHQQYEVLLESLAPDHDQIDQNLEFQKLLPLEK